MLDAQILQILGIAYLAVGIGALINPDFYKKLLEDYTKNLPVVYLNGFLILFIGYLLITFHGEWVKDWPVLITIIGWVAFLKGLFMLALPKMYTKFSLVLKKKKGHFIAEAMVVTLVGAFLSYLGFFVL